MNRSNYLSRLVCGVCFIARLLEPGAALGADSITEQRGEGLVIKSVPAGALVYLDGIERGVTPLSLPSLPEGEYAVRLRKDGYVDRRFTVRLRPESRLVVSIELEEARGQVLVEIGRSPESPSGDVLPLNPEILVDGVVYAGPLLSLPTGRRTIQARAFGWETASRTVYVGEGDFQRLWFTLLPAAFRLSGAGARRSRFNPANSGTLGAAELGFTVSAPGRGSVTITNAEGETVYFRELGRFDRSAQGITWNGRSGDGLALPDGEYRARIDAESIPWDDAEPLRQHAIVRVVIDSSVQIYPLALASGAAGLLYAPAPDVLPPGSFQIEGTVLFGKPFTASERQTALPFAAALRVPLAGLEAAAALNVTPEPEGAAIPAVAGSVKWRFLERSGAGELPLDAAAGVSYGWSAAGARSPFGQNAGAALFCTLAWRLNGTFSLLISPSALWTGERGYPDSAVPEAVLAGGILFRRSFITGGVSFRADVRLDGRGESAAQVGPCFLGAELRIFPPPSNCVITLLGGYWVEGSRQGGAGGAGIGLIW